MDANVKATLGPIIGKVTHNTARVLIEFDKEAEVTCTLAPDQGEPSTCTLTSRANVPVAFSFKDLKPKTHYTVSLSCQLPIPSAFWTLREPTDNPGKFNTGIVSCNEVSHQDQKTKENDLWASLAERVDKHELDYILHIGDQCYMDMGADEKKTPYFTIYPQIQATPKSEWESKRPAWLEILREKHRKTWRYASTAHVLANVPNITICDDHEVRDDWGFRKEDYTEVKDKPDLYYGELARQIYYEYQRQLREDIPWNDLQSLKREYYDEVLQGVGVSIMEYRGCRSWFREDNFEENHMGDRQATWIEGLFKEGGKFDSLDSVLFITPLPLFFLSHFGSQLISIANNDLKEHWNFSSVSQLAKLLDLLRGWKERKAGRELTIIGGDVHSGGWTDIYYKDKHVFTELVTSAINGKIPSIIEKAILAVLQKLGALNTDYHFKHRDWTRENNYFVVGVDNVDGVSTVKSQLVFLKHKD